RQMLAGDSQAPPHEGQRVHRDHPGRAVSPRSLTPHATRVNVCPTRRPNTSQPAHRRLQPVVSRLITSVDATTSNHASRSPSASTALYSGRASHDGSGGTAWLAAFAVAYDRMDNTRLSEWDLVGRHGLSKSSPIGSSIPSVAEAPRARCAPGCYESWR